VLLTGLAPNTKYYYRVLGPTLQASKLFHFTTPPRPGPEASVRMLAWADSGQATSDHTDEWEWSDYDPVVTVSQNTAQGAVAELTDVWQQDQAEQGASLNLTRRMNKELEGVTLLMHNGDISYARGSVTQWDTFMDQYKVMFSQVRARALLGRVFLFRSSGRVT